MVKYIIMRRTKEMVHLEKTKEQLHEEDLQRIRGFRLMDDDFMTACFSDSPECTELVLRIIMDKPDLKVTNVTVQKTLKNLQGRSLRLDIDAVDSENRQYDIEVQRSDKGAQPRRARYHSSLMDANTLNVGEDFELLPELYVVFITENDVFGLGRPIYEIGRRIIDGNLSFDDGSHIIFVNGANESETALGKLMHDFRCTDPDDMNYADLAERARYFKEDPEGVANMCKAIEEMREEAAANAREKTTLEAIRNLMKNVEWSAKEAMDALGIAVADQAKYLPML